ncbi:tubulin-tyrosine ligase family protein (macronuclear) [Tetrahymena thermophila SB210]|uniref:Tubulin-tyrosine ligase family protein n=1 Tax=Tetrahymena thermophila (strain SB210) TaxID=312017 RepID=A4VDD4_TETTS|nr:tubulin-tyrosine ligase family protein [Tetrahymena thermophila SB210]EDK31544.2 tubulin-tyrosine ligase family protein [Tetrahymena thermophila SB210]|eukprot:XP_001470895.2 tubulin-tyrosine ligase family protein [Tetrahymena thermophila SB210]
MKEAVKFPEISSRKNSSITSTQQQFAAIIQLQQNQTQQYSNTIINSKSSNIGEQKEQMNTSTNTTVDLKYDQSQVYQWEENQKKKSSNFHNISYIKSYNDSEPERPKQLFVQRTHVDGKVVGEQLIQQKGENYQGQQENMNEQKYQNNNNKHQQNQGNSFKNQNTLQSISDKYKVIKEDGSDQENQINRITQSNIQINYKNIQNNPLQAINKNQEEKQKISLVHKGNNNQQQLVVESSQNKQKTVSNANGNYIILNQGNQNYNMQQNYNQNNQTDFYNQNNQAYVIDQDQQEEDEEGVEGEQDDEIYDEDENDDEENEDGGDDDDDEEGDDDEDYDDENEDQEYPFLVLKDIINLKRQIKPQKKIIIDLSFTRYDVIRDVCEEVFCWQIQANANNRTDYNIQWIDSYIHEDDFRRMLPFQKVNHFPGSQQLGKKNLLGQNLLKMRNIFPQNYNFYPITWVLPLQYEDLKMYHYQNIKRKPYYIVKPEASCQGRGIYLTSRIDQLQSTEHYVVQEYIKNPYLIDNLKFDLRLYVLIKSVSPLKIFLYQDGLARFATVPYKQPNKHNITNLMMHLTNYALNKKSPDFIQNEDSEEDDIGHKRSFSSILKHLHDQGHDVQTLLMEIRQIIVKTIISAQPQMSHIYRTCQPKNEMNEMCFEVLGFDIMLDEDLKPYLIEVNHTPSFWTDSPLDLQVKKNLIIDTLNIVNVTNQTKRKYFEMRVQQQIASRSLFRKKYGPALNTGQEEFDEELIQQEFYEWEEDNMGAYMRIYPSSDDPLNYTQFLQASGSTLSDQLQRKKRFGNNTEVVNGNGNVFQNQQQNQQAQQQINMIQSQNNNAVYPYNYQNTIGSQRNQGEYQQVYSHEQMLNEQSPQRPLKLKPVQANSHQKTNPGQGNINNIMQGNINIMQGNISTESSNFTPIHVQQPHQQAGLAFQQLQQQYQNMNQNVYLPTGNYPNNQYRNLNVLPQCTNVTPGKLRVSLKGNTVNASGVQANNISNYQITGSGYSNLSGKKQFNNRAEASPFQANNQTQQNQQQFTYLDELEGITNFTYAEPTKPLIINMESPTQIVKGKKSETGPTIFQQKSLIINQQPKNINGLKLLPVDQTKNANQNYNNNSMNQGTIKKESSDPRKNRIASSQSFHQSSANHTLSSTNQSNSHNANNSMSTVQNEKVNEFDKNKKSLINTSILDISQMSQMTTSGKTPQINSTLKNQNSNTSFKKREQQAQTNSSKDEELDDYQYKKSLKNLQQQQQSSRAGQLKSNNDNKNLNNSFNVISNSQQINGGTHHRAISLVSEKNNQQIQKQLQEDMYPHNINQNLKRLNSSLQNQNGDQKQNGTQQYVGKVEENIYFPFGSPQTTNNNKIRNKSGVNPVMVAAYSNTHNTSNQHNNSFKQNSNTHQHNTGPTPVILPNVVINNQSNINQSKKIEGINNVIVPKQIEENDIKLPKQKPKHE